LLFGWECLVSDETACGRAAGYCCASLAGETNASAGHACGWASGSGSIDDAATWTSTRWADRDK